MSLSQSLLPEFDLEMAGTRKMMERVPDGKFDWQPHEKSMTLGRLASHVADIPNWTNYVLDREKLVLGPDIESLKASSQAELLEGFDLHVASARDAITAASDEDLQKIWTLEMNGQALMSLPRIAVLRGLVMNHMIHHRGQLSVYLRLTGIPVPGLYGPSADEHQ
jgi:uncharacterized damage-inducible protein DinB